MWCVPFKAVDIPVVDKVLDIPGWQVLRVPQVQAVMMRVVISQLHLVDVQIVWSPRVWAPQGAVHRLRDELKGGFLGPCAQAHGQGVMSTGTRPPHN